MTTVFDRPVFREHVVGNHDPVSVALSQKALDEPQPLGVARHVLISQRIVGDFQAKLIVLQVTSGLGQIKQVVCIRDRSVQVAHYSSFDISSCFGKDIENLPWGDRITPRVNQDGSARLLLRQRRCPKHFTFVRGQWPSAPYLTDDPRLDPSLADTNPYFVDDLLRDL